MLVMNEQGHGQDYRTIMHAGLQATRPLLTQGHGRDHRTISRAGPQATGQLVTQGHGQDRRTITQTGPRPELTTPMSLVQKCGRARTPTPSVMPEREQNWASPPDTHAETQAGQATPPSVVQNPSKRGHQRHLANRAQIEAAPLLMEDDHVQHRCSWRMTTCSNITHGG